MSGSSRIATSPVTAANPFVGPRPIETGQNIFGRDREIEQLYYLLSAERVVLLHSPSGAGKSSLIQAGLVPPLEQLFDVWGPTRLNLQPPEGGPAGLNRYVRSGNIGFEARIPKERQRPEELVSTMTLSEYFAGRPRRRSASPNVVLIFDQFEEILTIDPLALEAKHEFFEQLGRLLQDPHVWALFALREDYLAPLDPYANQVPTHLKNRFRLDLLGRDAAQEAISRSVEAGGRWFAPEAVVKLVNDLATMQVQRPDGTFERQTGPYVEPLHLQVACRGLWERMPEDRRTIDVDDIKSFGDVTQALAEYYEKEVAGIAGSDARVERAIREWVGGNLITPDGIRGQVLKGAGESEGMDNELIACLVETHLVRGEQRAGAVWYELSHDRLIEPVRSNNKEWFEAHLSKVQKVASVWEAQGRPAGLLLLGAGLVEATRWAAANESSLTGIERRFLEASETKQEAIGREQRQDRRLRLALGIAIALAVAACSAAGWAFFAQRKARLAQVAAANSEKKAIAQAAAAAKSAKIAKDEATQAANSAQTAEEKTAEAEKEKEIAEAKTREVRIALARSDVQAADVELNLKNRPSQTLAYVAQSLRINPESIVARNWLADLLLRKSWWVFQVGVRHKDRVISAVFSPDGRRVLTASADGTAHVWEAVTGKPVGMSLRHKGRVMSAVFSADGKRVVTASDDKTAQVWEADTGNIVGVPLQHNDIVESAAFSADGRRVVTASDDATARMWEADTGKPIGAPLQHKETVWSASFSPDGRRVVTASADGTAQVWEADTGKPVGEPLQHKGAVNFAVAKLSAKGPKGVLSAAFSADGRRLVTASCDGTAQVWEADTGKPVGSPLQHKDIVFSAAFSADGRRVVTASSDDTAQVWEADTGRPVGSPLQHKNSVFSATFSADGRLVVTASADGTGQVWEADTGKPVGSVLQHQEPVASAVFSADGRVVTASADGTAKVWEADTGKPGGASLQHEGLVLSAAFSPDGKRVVTASFDRTAQVWEADTGKPVGSPLQHKGPVNSAVFSPDGRRVVTASADGTAQVWEADTGKPVGVPLQHKELVWSASFSPDGRRVVTASADGTAQMWDANTGRPVGAPLRPIGAIDHTMSIQFPDGRHLTVKGVLSAAFSPDGRRVVTASTYGTAQVWEVATGTIVGRTLKHGNIVWSASFSPDGKRVVTASFDRTAQVWEADTGKPVGVPLRHADIVASAAFSADGRWVVTASADGTAQVWEADTGKRVLAPLQHKGPVASAVFSPDGRRVVTASMDKTAQVWEGDRGRPVGAPLQHEGIVHTARFSADGRRVLTASDDKTARVWYVLLGSGSAQDSALLADLAEAVGGYRIDESGSLAVLGLSDRMYLVNKLRKAYNVPPQENTLVWLLRRLSVSAPDIKSTHSLQ